MAAILCGMIKNCSMAKFYSKPFPVQKEPFKNLLKRPMFEPALVIEYLSQSRNKTISGIRMKNSIFVSQFGKMLLTWVTLMATEAMGEEIRFALQVK